MMSLGYPDDIIASNITLKFPNLESSTHSRTAFDNFTCTGTHTTSSAEPYWHNISCSKKYTKAIVVCQRQKVLRTLSKSRTLKRQQSECPKTHLKYLNLCFRVTIEQELPKWYMVSINQIKVSHLLVYFKVAAVLGLSQLGYKRTDEECRYVQTYSYDNTISATNAVFYHKISSCKLLNGWLHRTLVRPLSKLGCNSHLLYQCQDETCIYKQYVCDKHYDCQDHSDELHCSKHRRYV